MEWQFPLVFLMVAAAALYLARSVWRWWSGAKGGCGGTCACGKSAPIINSEAGQPTLIPAEKVTLLRRQIGEKR